MGIFSGGRLVQGIPKLGPRRFDVALPKSRINACVEEPKYVVGYYYCSTFGRQFFSMEIPPPLLPAATTLYLRMGDNSVPSCRNYWCLGACRKYVAIQPKP